jgi:hypothetical protein
LDGTLTFLKQILSFSKNSTQTYRIDLQLNNR